MASIKENLIAAKALIDRPEKWIQEGVSNEDRTCFCAMGAIGEVTRPSRDSLWTSQTPEYAALQAHVSDGRAVPTFNDDPDTTHTDIMALFDRAIEAVE